MTQLYTAWKLAAALRLSRGTIYRLIEKYRIKPQRIVGQSRLYDPLAFKRVLDMRTKK